MTQKTKVRSYINDHGLSVSADAYEGINRLLAEVLDQVCLNSTEDNMKTVMLHHCVLKTKVVTEKAKNDGVNLKPAFYKLAKDIQSFCVEQAMILSKEV